MGTTAAVVVIGNEILTGKFADENGPRAIERFRAVGVSLVRIAVIPDEVDTIADEVARASRLADVVVTSGGVGPTHDDVTLDGVARAFGLPLVVDDGLAALLDRFGLPRDDANLRMAQVPRGATLIDDPVFRFPIVRVQNVYVLPGVPKLFRSKLEVVLAGLRGSVLHATRVFTDEDETALAARLTAVAGRHPTVQIGSYPRWGEVGFRVMLTLEGTDADDVAAARADVAAHIDLVEFER